MEEPKTLKFEEIKIGKVFEFKKTISEKDTNNFAELTGDFNPMHIDKNYSEKRPYGKRIVHGMFGASLFSTILGMQCMGKNSIILSMELKFKSPIFMDNELTVRGEVIKKVSSLKIIILKLYIKSEDKILVEGITKVMGI